MELLAYLAIGFFFYLTLSRMLGLGPND